MILTEYGKCYTNGWNYFGQCGYDDNDSTIKQPYLIQLLDNNVIIRDIICGGCHSIIYDSFNECLYTFGCNTNKQYHPNMATSKIYSPTKLCKTHIGIYNNHFILKVFANCYMTVICVLKIEN